MTVKKEAIEIKEKNISIGEVAKTSGLTIRTLQYYDNIALLPASGRTEAGRRFYTSADMIKLQHIVFYRNLGFSLKKIKQIFSETRRVDLHASKLLDEQKVLLYNKAASIQNSLAAIEASQEIISVGKTPPWQLLTVFMSSMDEVNLKSWENFEFSESQLDTFNKYLPTIDDVISFYNEWKRLSIKAAAYQISDIELNSELALNLKNSWLKMVEKVTGGDSKNVQAYLKVDSNRSLWNPAEQQLIEQAEPYLDKLIKQS